VACRALGCILVELLTGKKAFDGATLPAIVMKIIQGSPPSLPEVYNPPSNPFYAHQLTHYCEHMACGHMDGIRALAFVCLPSSLNSLQIARISSPQDTSAAVVQLVADCLSKEPVQRPSATALLERQCVVDAAEQLDARLRDATAASTIAAHEHVDEEAEEMVEEEAAHDYASLREAAVATLRTVEPAWGPSGTGCFMWVRAVG
jgi:serine/threonine protein kinase